MGIKITDLANYVVPNPSLIRLCFFDFDASRVTSKLRYYPKEYVRQFMAEAMSFVLRTAPDQQLERGIRRVIKEAAKKAIEKKKQKGSEEACH
ncbi:hypothetical protein TSUD_385780 [Trifolium subterraneum]|uniref:Uncharacterized protein n=1 Tax=Trifolium subterraneum TaxID=3900 RepID=A0A2Z6MJM5_TRISU|nr:hypothetical protein TSUD_385780 [Trifolium subterraneum]